MSWTEYHIKALQKVPHDLWGGAYLIYIFAKMLATGEDTIDSLWKRPEAYFARIVHYFSVDNSFSTVRVAKRSFRGHFGC